MIMKGKIFKYCFALLLIIGLAFIFSPTKTQGENNLITHNKRDYYLIGENLNSKGYDLYKAPFDVCAEALEEIYNDGEYTYYLSCISSQHYLIVRGSEVYSLQEALSKKLITPKELEKHLILYKYETEVNDRFTLNELEYKLLVNNLNEKNYDLFKAEFDACYMALEMIYEDDIYTYSLTCISSEYYLIVKGKDRYSLQDALNMKLIKPEDLEDYLVLYKAKKESITHNNRIYYLNSEVLNEAGYYLYKAPFDACAEALEGIYNDGEYTYYLSCISSGNYVIVRDREVYSLQEALSKRLITPAELHKQLPLYKYENSKDTSISFNGTEFDLIGKKLNSANYDLYKAEFSAYDTALEKIYEDDLYTYSLSCISSEFYLIVKGEEKYNLQEALSMNLIRPKDLEDYMVLSKMEKKSITHNNLKYYIYGDVLNDDGYYLYKAPFDACLQALEGIYQDEEYSYYLSCISSTNYLIVKGDEKHTLQESLSKKLIKPEELEVYLGLYKIEKTVKDSIIHNERAYYLFSDRLNVDGYYLYKAPFDACALAIEGIYQDVEYTYYLSCLSSQNYLIVKGEEKYTLQDALSKKIIKPEEIEGSLRLYKVKRK